jgi:hypothetical protein
MATATAKRRSSTTERVLGAPKQAVEVIGVGHARDGRKVWCVPSTRDPNVWYIVVQASDYSHLWRSCPAGRFGKPCLHLGAVRLRIALELREEAEHEHAMRALEHEAIMGRLPDAEDRWMLTPKGHRALARADAASLGSSIAGDGIPTHPGDHAPLARDNRAFSMWK